MHMAQSGHVAAGAGPLRSDPIRSTVGVDMGHLRFWCVAASLVAAGTVLPATAAVAGTETDIVVSVIADAPPIRAGSRAPAMGVIQSSAGVSGLSVELQMQVPGSSFATVATVVSNSQGTFLTETPVLSHNTAFRWHFAGDGTHDPATSDTWTEYVSPRVRIRVSDRTPATGQRVVVRGRTNPNKAGNRVSLWRGTKPWLGFGPKTHHVRLVKGRVHADGRYRLVVRFDTSGTRRLYVRVAGGGGNVAGFSAYRRVSVG